MQQKIEIKSAHVSRAVEYAERISARGKDTSNECPGYDTKPFDGEAPVL